jgi:hypothetical protein
VDRLLAREDVREAGEAATPLVRQALAAARAAIAAGGEAPSEEEIAEQVAGLARLVLAPSLRPVINATGVIVHTNLGRAPLSAAAIEAMAAVSRGYSNLEYDLEAGERGSRYAHLEAALRQLTGAEAAIAVNNNASALLLVLSVIAGQRGEDDAPREVIVSRGQAVEIGGGFRIPDVMAQSGVRLVEVGTTNRTYLRDYERAITPRAAAIMRVRCRTWAAWRTSTACCCSTTWGPAACWTRRSSGWRPSRRRPNRWPRERMPASSPAISCWAGRRRGSSPGARIWSTPAGGTRWRAPCAWIRRRSRGSTRRSCTTCAARR